jgi:hypothetical protein
MFHALFNKNNSQKNERLAELEKRVKELESMAAQSRNGHTEYHIHIERVNIENPKLDELSFHLDALKINELSGSLNLGNNFSSGQMTKQPSSRQQKRQNGHQDQDGVARRSGHIFQEDGDKAGAQNRYFSKTSSGFKMSYMNKD